MIQKIILSDFLEYIKKNNPNYLSSFTLKKNLFYKASYIIYLQEFLKQYLKNQDSHTDNYLLIPINIDTL